MIIFVILAENPLFVLIILKYLVNLQLFILEQNFQLYI